MKIVAILVSNLFFSITVYSQWIAKVHLLQYKEYTHEVWSEGFATPKKHLLEDPRLGLEIEKRISQRLSISARYNRADINLSVGDKRVLQKLDLIMVLRYPLRYPYAFRQLGVIDVTYLNLHTLGFTCNYRLLSLNYSNKVKVKGFSQVEKKKFIALRTVGGLGVNYLPISFDFEDKFTKNNNFEETQNDIYSLDGSETYFTDFYNGNNPVKNRVSPTLQLGLGLDFFNNLNNSGIEIMYFLNIGMTKMVQSRFDFMYDNPFYCHGKSIGVNN